jgi:hypothetical protein
MAIAAAMAVTGFMETLIEWAILGTELSSVFEILCSLRRASIRPDNRDGLALQPVSRIGFDTGRSRGDADRSSVALSSAVSGLNL